VEGLVEFILGGVKRKRRRGAAQGVDSVERLESSSRGNSGQLLANQGGGFKGTSGGNQLILVRGQSLKTFSQGEGSKFLEGEPMRKASPVIVSENSRVWFRRGRGTRHGSVDDGRGKGVKRISCFRLKLIYVEVGYIP